MVNIFYSSDPHLNVNFNNLENVSNFSCITEFAKYVAKKLQKLEADIYIINGDISWYQLDIKVFLRYLRKHLLLLGSNCKVYRTLGNHCLSKNYTVDEYLNKDLGEDYLVTNPIKLDNVSIYGLNGFFDKSFYDDGFENTEEAVLETVAKRYFKDEVNLTYADLENIIKVQLDKLSEQIKDDNNDKILITHYLPKKEFLAKTVSKRTAYKNSMMGSLKLGDFLEQNNFSKCYFGHTHRREYADGVSINNVEYICNPLGTYDDWKKHKYIQPTQSFCMELLQQQWKKTLIKIL